MNLSVETFLDWKAQGLNHNDISKKLGINRLRLQKWVKQQKQQGNLQNKNYKTRHKYKITDVLSVDAFLELKEKGIPNYEIASHFLISEGSLNKWVRIQKDLGNLPEKKIERKQN